MNGTGAANGIEMAVGDTEMTAGDAAAVNAIGGAPGASIVAAVTAPIAPIVARDQTNRLVDMNTSRIGVSAASGLEAFIFDRKVISN
ncbi:MAG TPA: hypothetical protein VL179_16775 [Mycobacterium sp.]|nr:hypothetical protein [Mycobacterium sp.]